MSTTHEEVTADHSAPKKRPLVRVEPQSHRDDGSPVAGEGQAYVTRSGKLFHTQWCPTMDGHWRAANRGIYVTIMADVGLRGRCPQCDQETLKGRSALNWNGRRSGWKVGDSRKKRKPSTGRRNVRSFVLIRKATVTTVHLWQVTGRWTSREPGNRSTLNGARSWMVSGGPAKEAFM
ncbi:hypothetical protein [Arthrobacter sp. Rue61a]|uniref:hypothetical protein n=1 Tax=Arthrobacter sp. Rue61a TaxID=1118963 RepID=UPI0005BDD2A8|nr:hypothetical protein [Arthrobacter sp. Rue61a]